MTPEDVQEYHEAQKAQKAQQGQEPNAPAPQREPIQGFFDVKPQRILDFMTDLDESQRQAFVAVLGPAIVHYLKSQGHLS